MSEITHYVKENYSIAKELLSDLVSIRTVKDIQTDQYPFGKPIFECQKVIQHFCKKYNINYYNLSDYISYAHFGNNSDYLSVWTHLDAVPEGDLEKWLFNPYKLSTYNNRLYGRGVIDNKASIVYGLLAMKYLIDNKINTSKGLRVVFGTDEESGFEDIKYYKKQMDYSEVAIVLDNLFPVTSVEKGVINFDLIFNIDNNISIEGGTKRNVIAEKCCLKEKELNKNFIATPGHASLSNDFDNAIMDAISICSNEQLKKLSTNIKKLKQSDWYKDNYCSINIGTISTKNNNIKIELELRYIFNTILNKKEMIAKLEEYFKELNVSFKSVVEPKYFDETLVKELLTEYNDFFNVNEQSEISGYITYAHSLPNSVSFGPFTRDNNSAHCFNENILEEEFKKNIEFYTKVFTKKIR